MRSRLVLVALALALACARRSPRVGVGTAAAGLDAFLAAHRPGADENIHADRVERTETASYHIVQVRHGEPPHRHRQHDLTVVLLRGRGTVHVGDARFAVEPGDAWLVPRGVVHAFTNDGTSPTVTLAVFTPPLDAPDIEPAPEFDAPAGAR